MYFTDYSDIGYRAYVFTDKKQEVVARKKEIIDAVFSHHNLRPNRLLFVGFNPAIFGYSSYDIAVTQVSDECMAGIQQLMPRARYQDWGQLLASGDTYDAVICMDEYLTFAESDEDQHRALDQICSMTQQVAITTLRDYKNQGFKDREFSIPSVIRTQDSTRVFLEYHDYDMHDRNAWTRTVYQLEGDQSQCYAGFRCRQMFFKQCAKFSLDAGAREFLVHKNIMYKSLIKKNYEHVISIKFGQNGHNNTNRYNS